MDEKLWLLQNGIPLRQGTDGGDRGPAFREECRVHRDPGEEMAGQGIADDPAEHRQGASRHAQPTRGGALPIMPIVFDADMKQKAGRNGT